MSHNSLIFQIFSPRYDFFLSTLLEFGQGKNTTFYFTESFRCFRLNKSVLETKETKQADSQLYFAPKNFKIHLVVFENEFFEVAWLVSKKFQKLKYTQIMPTWSYLSVKVTYIEHLHDLCVFVFETFLKSPM